MVLVDVYVPELDGSYDFELDGEERAGALMAEVVSLIAQKEKLGAMAAKGRLFYHMERGRVLKQEETLACQGVKAGDRLILI